LAEIECCSYLDKTIGELEELAESNLGWKRIISLYKQKCEASIVGQLKNNPTSLLRYYELRYTAKEAFNRKGW
jgi:hypothetical protein